MKLGKNPARINSTILNLADYWNHTAVTAALPEDFGHENLDVAWPVQGNDRYRTAVWAGAAHETRIWAREAGHTVTIRTEDTLADYTMSDGFDPADPGTDTGSDVQAVASFRRRVGLRDEAGTRHRIGAYLALTPGDPDQLAAAVYVFAAIGVGLRLPAYALDDAEAGQVWTTRPGIPEIAGGHYVPAVGRLDGTFCVITWGRVQQMSAGFYRRYADEVVCYLSPEFLNTGTPPPGFDRARLRTDLQAFTRR